MGGVQRFLVKLGLLKLKANILLVGLANSGKTSIVNRLVNADQQDELAPTIGFSVERVTFDRCHLKVLDMSGAAKYHGLWEEYFQDAQGIVFVVDAADKPRFDEAAVALAVVAQHEETKGLPLLVLVNKMDLGEALQPDKVATHLDLPALSRQRSFHIAGCSAVLGTGIMEGMRWLSRQLKEQV